ncbi:MAG: DUF4062 domain-containing protein [Bacteroidales bacterium]|nr:MAG: DUF4062 domain-containing protein [Bacteroidales bacterium]
MQSQHSEFINIRVFISSTFRDFHAERDFLVKNVFPELRQWCLQYRINLVDIDLRWGITKEQAESGKVIELCLQEIDGARPFFICLLGGRYGWIPRENELPESIEDYPKVKSRKNISITHMEIEHAVIQPYGLNERSHHQMNSFFYFRDDNSYPTKELLAGFSDEDIKEHFNTFLEQTADGIEKLKTLKSQIRELINKDGNRDHLHGYSPFFNPNLENPEEKKLKGRFEPDSLKPFGEQVVVDIKKAISTSYRDRIQYYESISADDNLGFDQIEFLTDNKSRVFAGRYEYLKSITDFSKNQTSEILLVTSESGSGKSAILSKASLLLRNDKEFNPIVLNYFCGIGSNSDTTVGMLQKFVKQLSLNLDIKTELASSFMELVKQFYDLIERISRSIIIFIDGVNQMENPSEAVAWIDERPKGQLRFIISCTPNEIPSVLLKKEVKNLFIHPFSRQEKIELLDLFPSIYSKTLSDGQKQAILEKEGTGNPLYLKTLLEELRLFGSFEQIESKIAELPTDLPLLFNTLLERLESEYGQELVLWFFVCIELSEIGFTESELNEMLRFENERNTLPLLIKQSQELLIFNGPYIRIAHQAISKAAKNRYLQGASSDSVFGKSLAQGKVSEMDAHSSIMNFFLKKGSQNGNWIEEKSREARGFHYHAIKSGKQEAVKPYFCNPSFLISSCKCKFDNDNKVYRGFYDFMHLLYVSFDMPIAKAIIDLFRSRSYLLSRFPHLIPNEIYNYSFEIDDPTVRKILVPNPDQLRDGVCVVKKNLPNIGYTGHRTHITSISVAPVGVHILTGSNDGSVALWEREKKTPIVFGYYHRSRITSTSFSPNGLYGLSASVDGTLLLWDCSSGENTTIKSPLTKWDKIPIAAFIDNDSFFYIQNNTIFIVDIYSRLTKWHDDITLEGFPELDSNHFSYDPETSLLAILKPNGFGVQIFAYSISERSLFDNADIDLDIKKITIKGNFIIATDKSNCIVAFNLSTGQLDLLQTEFNICTISSLLNNDFILADYGGNFFIFKPDENQMSNPILINDFRSLASNDFVFCKQSFRIVIPSINGAFFEFCLKEKLTKFYYESSFSINKAALSMQGLVAFTGVYQASERREGERLCFISSEGDIKFSNNNDHNNTIRDIVSIGGNRFISFHSDGKIVNWEGNEVVDINCFEHSFTSASKSNSSSAILVGTNSSELFVLQQPRSLNRVNFSFPHDHFVNYINSIHFCEQPIAFVAGSGNGSVSYIGSNGSWAIQVDALRITSIVYSSALNLVASGNLNGMLRMVKDGIVVFENTFRPTTITSLLFSENDNHLWLGYADGYLLCLSALNFELITGTVIPGVPIKLEEIENHQISVITNNGINLFFYFYKSKQILNPY